jgi:hypothetical protein
MTHLTNETADQLALDPEADLSFSERVGMLYGDMDDARAELGQLQSQADENDVEIKHVRMLNPLGLVASDLMTQGWDTDDSGSSWIHSDHGACSFLEATKIEADGVGGQF